MGGGLISDDDDAKTKLSRAMIDDIVYRNKTEKEKESLLSNTLKKLNEITDFNKYPEFGAPHMLGKVFVNKFLNLQSNPHQANMLKIAEADEKARQLEEARQLENKNYFIAAEKKEIEDKIAWNREMGKRDMSLVTTPHAAHDTTLLGEALGTGGYGYAYK